MGEPRIDGWFSKVGGWVMEVRCGSDVIGVSLATDGAWPCRVRGPRWPGVPKSLQKLPEIARGRGPCRSLHARHLQGSGAVGLRRLCPDQCRVAIGGCEGHGRPPVPFSRPNRVRRPTSWRCNRQAPYTSRRIELSNFGDGAQSQPIEANRSCAKRQAREKTTTAAV